MSVLSRIVESIGLKSTFMREMATTPKKEPDMDRWSDNGVLRSLASEYRSGNSEWTIGSGMADFFDGLDAYNERRDGLLQIDLLISRRYDEFFEMMMSLDWHQKKDRVAHANKGPEEISSDDLLVRQGNRLVRACYNADENKVKIETVHGWKEMDFQAGDPLRDALSLCQMSTSRAMDEMNLEFNG